MWKSGCVFFVQSDKLEQFIDRMDTALEYLRIK